MTNLAKISPEASTLSQAARAIADAGADAVGWVADPENERTIGDLRGTVERELRKGVVRARRLAEAAQRPMSVAVFGASQVGKSHLISVLARKGDALLVQFDGIAEPVNYIERINPDKDKEASGLVSRFTVRPPTGGAAPAGHPVALRLLSHADVIKIIANSYFFDGTPGRYEDWPEASEIDAHVAPFLDAPGPEGRLGLTMEDVWDIGDYFQRYMPESELTKRLGAYWEVAARVAPRLPLERLGPFFSILWGRHEDLTRLYLSLVEGLAQLGFVADAFVPFEAIDASGAVESILDVDALKLLDSPDAPMLSVAAGPGRTVQLSRPVVSALTAELRITILEKPWDFLDDTDLLDFPGYRGRGLPAVDIEDESGPKGLARHLQTNRAGTIREMLLRGKVEYLFQRYVAEQEITAMLLCAKESNLDVNKLPDVVSAWVAATHGPAPKDRRDKPPLLYFVFTRFDRHFEEKESDRSLGLDKRFEGRMKASLLDAFGKAPDSWVQQWTPGTPFSNCYLMRNPNIKNKAVFTFDDQRESGVLPERAGFLDDLRTAFLSVPAVQRHFADPALAFDEMMRLNDGGATLIARSLAPVCNPQIKLAQVRDRLRAVRDRLHEELGRFYVSTDLEKRLAERTAAADQVIDELYHCEDLGRFGSLIRGLTIDTGTLADRFHYALTWHERQPASNGAERPAAATPSPERPRPGRIRPGQAAPAAAAPDATTSASAQPQERRRTRQAILAEAAQKAWLERMYAQTETPAFCSQMGIASATLRELVGEIAGAAHRLNLSARLAEKLTVFAHEERRDELIAKAAVLSERVLNRFVSDLGWRDTPAAERPTVTLPDGGARTVFAERPVAYLAESLPAEPMPFRQSYFDDWIFGFYQIVQDNARSGEGGFVNVAQNARLGRIIDVLDQAL